MPSINPIPLSSAVPVTKTNGNYEKPVAAFTEEDVRDFRSSLSEGAKVAQEQDPEYENGIARWSKAAEKRATPEDVSKAVLFSVKHRLEVAVSGGVLELGRPISQAPIDDDHICNKKELLHSKEYGVGPAVSQSSPARRNFASNLLSLCSLSSSGTRWQGICESFPFDTRLSAADFLGAANAKPGKSSLAVLPRHRNLNKECDRAEELHRAYSFDRHPPTP
ncbi:uncharacterized protein PAC_09293 [Phialocephala subalpina]|uniref:Uncharacterized protein n=1 Tax=Phialocephala subalpina TaxID=576137 RepID=A0A1L7X312_9HELO|nr:uncharacterized protein PAC_09293 [Phialocephala subalpina]